jgi:hypothetical protein
MIVNAAVTIDVAAQNLIPSQKPAEIRPDESGTVSDGPQYSGSLCTTKNDLTIEEFPPIIMFISVPHPFLASDSF